MNQNVPVMTSTKPYLVRAFYEWILDNGTTPYLLVSTDIEGVEVPQQHVNNGQIVLNLSPTAIHGLNMDNEWISFSARFSGRAMDVFVPIPAILAIYARENGQGMAFQAEPQVAESEKETIEAVEMQESQEVSQEPQPSRPKGRPSLKVVK